MMIQDMLDIVGALLAETMTVLACIIHDKLPISAVATFE